MNIGPIIKEYRTKNNLTQAAFGKIVGVNKQTVSKWENGVLQPSTKKIFEITQAINIPVNSVFKNDIQNEEGGPFIYAHKTKYDVGLNSVYRCVHDFMSLCKFIELFESAHQLLEPDAESVGFLLINTTIDAENSHEKAILINSIYRDCTNIIIEIPNHTLGLTKENVSYVKCVGAFNNESYVFNIYMAKKQEEFIQLIVSFHNDIVE